MRDVERPYELVLTIEMESFEAALRAYAHLIDVPRHQLGNDFEGVSFSGTCVPSLFTLLRPAHVKVQPAKE